MQDLEYIEQIWQLTLEWDANWDSWKVGKFTELQTGEMENASITAFKKLAKLARELKVLSLSLSCYIYNLRKIHEYFKYHITCVGH